MALARVTRKNRQTVTPGRESGGRIGRNVGAGLGAIIGGIGGFMAGGPAGAVGGAALGAGKGALTGAGAGQLAGDMIQPARQGSVEVQQSRALSPVQIAQDSQQMLDGLRALEELGPELQAEYATPLTQGYLQSMVQLKNQGAV